MIITDIIKAYITDSEYVLPNDCDINTVCAVSERHDLAHLISGALEKQGVLPKGELGASLKKQKLLAIMRREQQDYELTRITSIFQNEEIPYILLKGAVMKNLYPHKWLFLWMYSKNPLKIQESKMSSFHHYQYKLLLQ